MDSNNINFNELWSGQKIEQPDIKDLLLKIDKFKKYNRNKIIFTNVLLFSTSVFILLIWYYFQPQYATSKIGIIMMILAMTIIINSSSKSLNLFKIKFESVSNEEYLKHLLAIKEKQQFMYTTLMNLYFILLSTGISLYMYEYTSRMSTKMAVLTYVITWIWILLNWFYTRPKQIKKQLAKVNELIIKFESIQKQLN
ncbi:MAG: hypothetical protein NTW25_04900 [Candidatus Kapabacteria bacterium]|nr:hypothetical protein [Candidatus Kapabacteria bacterium]